MLVDVSIMVGSPIPVEGDDTDEVKSKTIDLRFRYEIVKIADAAPPNFKEPTLT